MISMHVDRSELVREEVSRAKLGCGLEVCVLRKSGFAKKYGVLATRFGSIDSRFRIDGSGEVIQVPDGIAHFLEHKLFEEEDGSIDDVFSELGAYSNAFTNYTMTGYLFSCVDNFWPSLDTLLGFVMRPHFTDKNVEKEKGIIEQEIRMMDDSPDWQAVNGLLQSMYQRNPVRVEIVGSVESINRINKETLYQCYRAFYHPSNMTLFVVGDVDPAEVVEAAAKVLDGRDFGPVPALERVYPEEPQEVGSARVERRMAVSEPILCFGYKDNDIGHEGQALLRRIVGMEMLLDMMLGRSSQLYNALYEEGLLDASFDDDFDYEKEYGLVTFEGKTHDPYLLADRVVQGIEAFLAHGVSESEFELTRRKVMGSMLRGFNSLEYIAYNFLTYHFRQMSLLDRVSAADALSLEEVVEMGKRVFNRERMVISVISPPEARP
ncbi:MAG: pitrilysin family protein [Clostridia bacterium]|nr:pitrilysin family protein [Clostridia bacterium]